MRGIVNGNNVNGMSGSSLTTRSEYPKQCKNPDCPAKDNALPRKQWQKHYENFMAAGKCHKKRQRRKKSGSKGKSSGIAIFAPMTTPVTAPVTTVSAEKRPIDDDYQVVSWL